MEKQVSKNFSQIFLDILNYKFLRTFRKQQLDGMYNNKITYRTRFFDLKTFRSKATAEKTNNSNDYNVTIDVLTTLETVS